jgi:6-pyruvoyl-tetrahydropterin synthase
MKKNGFKHVYYSIDNHTIIREKITDMVSIQISHALRLKMNITCDTLDIYYENMIKKFFPKQIRKENMYKFIKYNLTNILPLSKVVISNKYMTINNNNKYIISSIII